VIKRYAIRRVTDKQRKESCIYNDWCVVDQHNGNRKVRGESFITADAAQNYADFLNSTEFEKMRPA